MIFFPSKTSVVGVKDSKNVEINFDLNQDFKFGSQIKSENFSFKIAALSKEDIVPLYDKVNALAGSTAPVYGENGQFMKGVLTKITIGDYLKAVPGFISTVGFSWDLNTPWEIDTENGPRVPHVLTADISFTPIHNFAPTVNSRYIA